MPTGRARALSALAAHHVQFVVLSSPRARRLRRAVSSHPTNLAALSAALGGLEATLAPMPAGRRGSLRRVGATLGAVRVRVVGAELELLVGAEYAAVRERAVEGARDGVEVLVAEDAPQGPHAGGQSTRAVATRLLALAGELEGGHHPG